MSRFGYRAFALAGLFAGIGLGTAIVANSAIVQTSALAPATLTARATVIPQPVEVRAGDGFLRVAAGTIIATPSGDVIGRHVAGWLGAEIERTYGVPVLIQTTGGGPRKAASGSRKQAAAAPATGGESRASNSRGSPTIASPIITIALDPKAPVDKPQGYSLDIDSQRARITARDEAGLFYGAVTLWQLLTPPVDSAGTLTLPAVSIRDWPRFGWRGLLLDSARHYVPTPTIKSLIDAMAVYKLNVLHWHLTDDQGWRLQIRRYPQLTDIGAWRTSPVLSPDGRTQRYGGYYTQAEVREIVAYAAARQITIVPEIDMPGHAQAAIASVPEIGVTGERPPVSADWGVNRYLFGVSEQSFAFIRNVLDEVLDLFPSTFIHVGGDEAVKDQWQASPAVQAKLHSLHLADEHQLQTWFMERLGRYLEAHQRRLIGWDEILEGGIPASSSVMSWRGTQGAIDAARLDHDVVLSPAPTLYLDNLESYRGDEPSGRLAVQSLEKVYQFEPVPAELTPAQARHVLGAQANLWTEHKSSPLDFQYAIFPRELALAELTWSPRESRDWSGFLARMPAALSRLRRLGLYYSDIAFAAGVDLDTSRDEALAAGAARVKLETQTGLGTLRYTLDGTAPTERSRQYEAPFSVDFGTTVTANAFDAEGHPLAAPRSRRFDLDTLLTWNNSEFEACPNDDLELRVLLDPDAQVPQPVYDINVFDSCWIARDALLTGVTRINVEAASLARNHALAFDESKVVIHPAHTGFGELQVLMDRCDGPLLAEIPLPGAAAGRTYSLASDVRPPVGVHDLCFRFTGSKSLPMPALGRVRLMR